MRKNPPQPSSPARISKPAQEICRRLILNNFWGTLPPALKGAEAQIADIATIAFEAAQNLNRNRIPKRIPQRKAARKALHEAMVEAGPPHIGAEMTAARGGSFLEALRQNEPDLREAMGTDAYENLCSNIDAAIQTLRGIAAQGREAWRALELPAPPSPWNKNAERNYFVAIASRLFKITIGRPHDAVVAALANEAYPPADTEGGISSEAVAKLRRRAAPRRTTGSA